MKVVLIPPPHISHNREAEGAVIHPPLGLLCISAVARQAGHDIVITDLNIARQRRILPPRGEWDEAAAYFILSHKPDIVGFSTLCSSFPSSVQICKALKRKSASIPVLFGGPQATLVYRDLLLEIPEIDFVLMGEADYSFTDFLDSMNGFENKPVQGLAYRKNGDVTHEDPKGTIDIQSLPMPDYGFWAFTEVIEKEWCSKKIPIDAGRGCPFNCYFCSTSRFFKT